MEKNGQQPAFPIQVNHGEQMQQPDYGLTKREYFAAMADVKEYFGKNVNQEYATLITGIQPPDDKKDRIAWNKFWLNVEANLKLQKADALLTQLSKQE